MSTGTYNLENGWRIHYRVTGIMQSIYTKVIRSFIMVLVLRFLTCFLKHRCCNRRCRKQSSRNLKWNLMMWSMTINILAGVTTMMQTVWKRRCWRVFRLKKSTNCIDEAKTFYNLYAKVTRFSIQKDDLKRDKNGYIISQKWVCYREGHLSTTWGTIVD